MGPRHKSVWLVLLLLSHHTLSTITVLNTPSVSSSTSGTNALAEKNYTIQLISSASNNPFGEQATITFSTPLGDVLMDVDWRPRRSVMQVTDTRQMPTMLEVVENIQCEGTKVPVGVDDLALGNFTLSLALNALSPTSIQDFGSSSSIYQFGANDSFLVNPGRQLLSSNSNSDSCGPGEKQPCNACRIDAATSRGNCRDAALAYYMSFPPAHRPILTVPGVLGAGPHTTTDFNTFWNTVLDEFPGMELINEDGVADSVPTATCIATPFDADLYDRDPNSLPDVDGTPCVPSHFNRDATPSECLGLNLPYPCGNLMTLSQDYSDQEFFTGTGPTRVFQAALQQYLVSRTNDCGVNFRRGTLPVSQTQLLPYDYFEPDPSTPCACTYKQLAIKDVGQRSCVLNMWDVQRANGTYPLLPYPSKCMRQKGLWLCSPMIAKELLRDVSTETKTTICTTSIPSSPCKSAIKAQQSNTLGQDLQQRGLLGSVDQQPVVVDPNCTLSLNDTYHQTFGFNSSAVDAVLAQQFGSLHNGTLTVQTIDFGGVLGGAEQAGCAIYAAFGGSCGCNDKVTFTSTNDQLILYSDVQQGYALASQARAIDAYISNQGQLLSNLQTTQAATVLLTQQQFNLNTQVLANLQSTLQLTQRLVSNIGGISDQATQLDLLTQKYTNLISTQYANLEAQLDQTAGVAQQSQAQLAEAYQYVQAGINLARAVQTNLKRSLDRANKIIAGAAQFQTAIETQIVQMQVQRDRYASMVSSTIQAMRATRTEKNLFPFVSGGQDVLGNYGVAPTPLISAEKIMSIDMQRLYYLTPVWLDHVPPNDTALLADIAAASANLSVGLAVTNTSIATAVSSYMDLDPQHVLVHQISMEYLCNAEFMMNYVLNQTRTEDVRSLFGPPSCILGTHVTSRMCTACRARLLHRTCIHAASSGSGATNASSLLLNPSHKTAVANALDSDLMNAIGLCNGGPVEVRVPVWSRDLGLGNQTDPIDTGIVGELDRMFGDACEGKGNDITIDPAPSDADLLGPIDPSRLSSLTLPCATPLNQTLFPNDTCLGLYQPLDLSSLSDPAVRGATLEARLPVWNNTALGGFFLYSDGNNGLRVPGLTWRADQCASDRFSNALYIADNNGSMPMYWAVQQAMATSLLIRLMSRLLRELEYKSIGSLPQFGVVVTLDAVQSPDILASDGPPIDPTLTTSELWQNPSTGMLTNSPNAIPYLNELYNQSAHQVAPLVLTPQAFQRNIRTTVIQRSNCVKSRFAAVPDAVMPERRLRFVREEVQVKVRFRDAGNGTIASPDFITTALGLHNMDLVDQSVLTRSATSSLLVGNGFDLAWIGPISCAAVGMPSNTTAINTTADVRALPFFATHDANGTQIPCPLPLRGQTAINGTVRSWYIYDAPTKELPRRSLGNSPGRLNAIDLALPDSEAEAPFPWHGYQSRRMFDIESFLAERGSNDTVAPRSPVMDYDPSTTVNSPLFYLTQLQRIALTDPNNSSHVEYVARCLKPPNEWNEPCQILDRYRIVACLGQELWNPELWTEWCFEKYDDQSVEEVLLTVPESLLLKLIDQQSSCPTAFLLQNGFSMGNAVLQFRPPLSQVNTTLEINITSTSVGQSCYGVQYLQLSPLTAPPVINVALGDCQPVEIHVRQVSAFNGTVWLNRKACWDWVSTSQDLMLTPAAEPLETVVQEQIDTRAVVLAYVANAYQQAIGALNQLLLDSFNHAAPSVAPPLADASTGLSLSFVVAALQNFTSSQLPPVAVENGTLPVDQDPNTTNTILPNLLSSAFVNITQVNDTQLQAILSQLTTALDGVKAVIQSRQNGLPGLANLTALLGSLNITSANGIARLRQLVEEAQNVSVVYRNTIATLASDAFKGITPEVWQCLVLLGQQDVFGANTTESDAVLAADETIVRYSKEVYDAHLNNLKGVAGAMASVPWLRAIVWFLAFEIPLLGIGAAVYWLLMVPGYCGDCSLFTKPIPPPGTSATSGGTKSKTKTKTKTKERKRSEASDEEPDANASSGPPDRHVPPAGVSERSWLDPLSRPFFSKK